MRTKLWLLAGFAVMASTASGADAPPQKQPDKQIAKTFVAEATGNTVAIYSNSKKKRRCDVFVNFSAMLNGERQPGVNRCNETDIREGTHVLVCANTNPILVDPKIEGPVDGTCK